MAGATRSGDGESPEDLVLEIVDTLETIGLDRDQYRLHDSVDVESLERLVSTSPGQVEVRFTVEGGSRLRHS